MPQWPTRDFENKFVALVNAELTDEENARLVGSHWSPAQFLTGLLLTIPRDDVEFDRMSIASRPLDLWSFLLTPTCSWRCPGTVASV